MAKRTKRQKSETAALETGPPIIRFPAVPRARTAAAPRAGGFVVVVDTREQLPYSFLSPVHGTPLVEVIRAALPSGDYSIQGHETQIAIERKKPCELFTCFTSERDRFRREYQRLSTYRVADVVIEGHIEECATLYNRWFERGEWHQSPISPHVVINSLVSWRVRFGVGFHFAGTRENAETLTFRLLEKYAATVARETVAAAGGPERQGEGPYGPMLAPDEFGGPDPPGVDVWAPSGELST